QHKMADAGMAVVQEQFSCSVCLEILKNPVTIPCGHSYCAECIENCWDRGVYSCPQCRETFSLRPALRTNVVLAEVVKKLGKTGLGAASPPPPPPPPPPPACCPAGPGDVPCDACPAVKMRAVKSCLVCLVSYCENHLRLHQEVIPGNRHSLVRAAVGRLQEIVCAAHGMPRNVYCRRDRVCVCYLCILDEHRGHDTVSTAAERKEKQDQLGVTRGLFQQRIREKEQELFNLRQAVDSLKRSAQGVAEDSERAFAELARALERAGSRARELLDGHSRAAVLLQRLEQEIAELRGRDAELSRLAQTEDHVRFLQNYQSVCACPGAGDLPSFTVNPDVALGAVGTTVHELKRRIADMCKEDLVKISKVVNEAALQSFQIPEPRTRAEFLQFHRSLVQSGSHCTTTVQRSLVQSGSHCTPTVQRSLVQSGSQCTPTVQRSLVQSGSHCNPTVQRSLVQSGSHCNPTVQRSLVQSGSYCTPTVHRSLGQSGSHCTATVQRSLVQSGSHCTPTVQRSLVQSGSHCTPTVQRSLVQSGSHCTPTVQRSLVRLLTLDPKTAHRQLCLSEGNRGVTWSEWTQTCPRLPERFDGCWQVLGREGLSGTRCYWEVEWSGEGAQIGAAYKGIGRKAKGPDCRLGHSDKSWSLACSGSGCCFWHGNEKTAVTSPPSCRIGVYLDHVAGILSFYSVSGEGMTLLHRVQTTFTEPLYLGFGFCGSGAAKGCTPGSSVALCALE
ncbi:TRI16 protein, partial [Atractosteus spatula]|nr:TRI16 protein [Atractosteus spatula]